MRHQLQEDPPQLGLRRVRSAGHAAIAAAARHVAIRQQQCRLRLILRKRPDEAPRWLSLVPAAGREEPPRAALPCLGPGERIDG